MKSRQPPKALVSWSSGKDSAMALYRVLESNAYQVMGLLTTVSDAFHRVSMHGVREELLDLQAESIGIPIRKIHIPYPCPNDLYEQNMRELLRNEKSRGVSYIIFGDLFLEDIRKYREEKLAQVGITPIFPLWKENTTELAKQMLTSGFHAKLTCVDPKRLGPSFLGREFDRALLNDLPCSVDPCGENGEFHTFVYECPLFKRPIEIVLGERVMRDGFQYVDVLPKSTSRAR